MREYERTSTTTVCAYVAPILESYLNTLSSFLEEREYPPLYLMGSRGGVLTVDEGLRMPAALVESGPAAGVVASAALGEQLGVPDLISFDMGGTTAKASLIEGGEVTVTTDYEVGGTGSQTASLAARHRPPHQSTSRRPAGGERRRGQHRLGGRRRWPPRRPPQRRRVPPALPATAQAAWMPRSPTPTSCSAT